MSNWNPWHGCHKISEGCKHCYVYRADERHGKLTGSVTKNKDFDLPIRKTRDGEYKLKRTEIVYTCFSSDFFVPDADEWRGEAWAMMRERSDLFFFFITKRIDRFYDCIPDDWGMGYPNVAIACTVENQKMADYRLPIYLDAPIRYKSLACEPLLEQINIEEYLKSGVIEQVVAGGESGPEARVCNYDWILDIRRQCMKTNIDFRFKQTGAHFVRNGVLYNVPRKLQHRQATRAGINVLTRPQTFEPLPDRQISFDDLV